jgi:ABC-type nitrate/sulfonate/bicarbonate transport system permease component
LNEWTLLAFGIGTVCAFILGLALGYIFGIIRAARILDDLFQKVEKK